MPVNGYKEQTMKKPFVLIAVLLAIAPVLHAAEDASPATNLPASKRTRLGLYVTAKQAYQKWQADPDGVKILDVRTPEEYIFVGHPAMAQNIPLLLIQHKWSAARKGPVMTPNRKFVEQVKRTYRPGDTILIMCRSGGRSAAAVDVLSDAGFKRVYTVTDGFEGDKVRDPASPSLGKRTKNGWRNSEIPWTYDLKPELMYLPDER